MGTLVQPVNGQASWSADDVVIVVDCSNGPVTFTLPDATTLQVGDLRIVTARGGTLTVAPVAGQTLNGGSALTTTTGLTCVTDAQDWVGF